MLFVAYVVWIRSLTLAVESGQPGPYQLAVGSWAVRRNKRISIHHIGDVGYFGLNNYVSKRGLNMTVYYAYQQTPLNIIIEFVVGNAAGAYL